MGFDSLLTDTVCLIKKNGEQVEFIRASVQKNKIFINRSDIFIEVGDLIKREMSNGGEENYEVMDPGFHEKFHGIPAGYQMEVRKLGAPEAQKLVQSITYNFNGHNARVNNHSVDNSTNTVNKNPDAIEFILALRSEIENASISAQEKTNAEALLNAVESQVQSGNPSKVVIGALLTALPQVANVATIASTLLQVMGSH